MKPFNWYTTLYAPTEGGEEGKGDGSGGDKGNKEGKPDSKGESDGNKYDDKEVESAVSLYRALQDPDLAEDVINALAKKVNVKVEKGDTKTEVKEKIEGAVTRRFKAKLGKDYEKFSDMVGPLIEEAVEEIVAERLGSQQAESVKDSWDKSVDDFTKTYVVPKKVESIMQELIEESPPNFKRKGFDAQRYLLRRYKEACEEAGIDMEEVSDRKSVRSTRRKGDEDDLPDFIVKDAPKDRDVSVDEAVELAMKGIKLRHRS